MKPIPLIGVALMLALAACSQNPDGSTSAGMPNSPLWHATTSMENKLAYYGKTCETLGYQPNTDAFRGCVHSELVSGREQAAENMQRSSDRMHEFGERNRSRMETTTCNQFGNSIRCTTW